MGSTEAFVVTSDASIPLSCRLRSPNLRAVFLRRGLASPRVAHVRHAQRHNALSHSGAQHTSGATTCNPTLGEGSTSRASLSAHQFSLWILPTGNLRKPTYTPRESLLHLLIQSWSSVRYHLSFYSAFCSMQWPRIALHVVCSRILTRYLPFPDMILALQVVLLR